MRLPLIFVIATTVIDSMGIGLILPVMPALLREVSDISLADAALYGGVLVTAFAFMQFLFGPVIGALSDRYGRRPVMLISLLVMALDYIVMALAGAFWVLLVGRMVGGIAAATQSTATAFMADISKPEEKAARFGMIGAAFGMGFVFGPLLGGLLAEFGTRAPFYAAAALAATNLIFGYFVMPETLKPENRRPLSLARSNPLGAFKNVSATPQLRRLLWLFFLYQVAFMVYPAIWAFFTEERFGWSPRMIGFSLGAFGIAMALVQGGLIRLILRWFGDRGTILYGLAFNFFAFLVLAFIESGTLAILFIPLTALGAVVTPAVQGMMSRATSDNSQGELQGVLSSTAALATIISPLIMTQIFATFARQDAAFYLPGAPFLVSMFLMLVCALVFLAGRRQQTV
ncbi:TCR/Tet family MFS transporter [Boseongicola aestuarii]|uniref:Tetracycline resistance protein, class C n=1 Tax=Boseongicola aestuarii TaxID=1470561 RepID=A0A238J0V4_9RHOB|nr:TCR/Tet family MFS transporter [Boseongicola aestuarii]SMX23805.1 Tetracycline resistance protein, class C [Boseongicola aestuarii]